MVDKADFRMHLEGLVSRIALLEQERTKLRASLTAFSSEKERLKTALTKIVEGERPPHGFTVSPNDYRSKYQEALGTRDYLRDIARAALSNGPTPF